MSQEEKTDISDDSGLFDRLLRRRVIQSVVIYVAAAWGVVEILLTMQETFGWPVWLARVVLALFIAGFPAVLMISWFRDLNSRGARLILGVAAISLAGMAFWLTINSAPPVKPVLDPVNESIATVAVIPFVSATGKDSNNYLARGFSAELTGRLSKHPDLAVIQEESVNSPLLFNLISSAMAAELNADYFIEGTIRREDTFLEVNASLKGIDGQVLWSEVLRESYTAEKVTAMQRRISGEVARVLGAVMDAPLYCGETTDLYAMELYLRGRMSSGTRTREGMEEGIVLLTQAIEADPYYGRAWNVLGEAHTAITHFFVEDDPQQAGIHGSMGRAAFRRALEICPTLGFAYKVIVPSYEGIDNDSIDQEMQYRDALAMDPNDANLLRQYSFHLAGLGMLEEALAAMERAYANEPLQSMMPEQLSHYLAALGRCEGVEKLAQEQKMLGGRPNPTAGLLCAMNSQDSDWFMKTPMFNNPMATMGFEAEAFWPALFDENNALRSEIREKIRQNWEKNPTVNSPFIYMGMGLAVGFGDFDLVFEMLNAIVCDAGFCSFEATYSPLFTSAPASSRLRADPRFVEVIEKTNIPEYWRKYGWPNGCKPEGDSFSCS